MTDYAADAASSSVGTTLTVRTGALSGDTVPAGSYVIWRNSGAGSHTITLGNNFATDTGNAPSRTITIPAGGFKGGRITSAWGDSNGRVSVTIDSAPTEITYMIPGGI